MIDNDQSTIIEAPEVYKSIPTHFPSKNQRQNVPETKIKNVDFDTFDGHAMVNYIQPNMQEIIFGPIDHSETILGPFKKLPFNFRHHRTVHTHCLRLGIVLFLIHSNVTD